MLECLFGRVLPFRCLRVHLEGAHGALSRRTDIRLKNNKNKKNNNKKKINLKKKK